MSEFYVHADQMRTEVPTWASRLTSISPDRPISLTIVGSSDLTVDLAIRASRAGLDVVVSTEAEESLQLSLDHQRSQGMSAADTALTQPGTIKVMGLNAAAHEGIDVCLIVGPFAGGEGEPEGLAAVADLVGKHLEPGGTVVLVAPVKPGTTAGHLVRRLAHASRLTAGRGFSLGYAAMINTGSRPVGSKERALWVAGGHSPDCAERVGALGQAFGLSAVLLGSPTEAEFVAQAVQARAVINRVFSAELAALAPEVGLDLVAPESGDRDLLTALMLGGDMPAGPVAALEPSAFTWSPLTIAALGLEQGDPTARLADIASDRTVAISDPTS